MRRWLTVAGVAVTVFGLTACRQPDGPMPQPNAVQRNEIGDIGRDLARAAAGSEESVKDLGDDLAHNTPLPASDPKVDALIKSVVSALNRAKLTEPASNQLAEQLYYVMNARQISRRQAKEIADRIDEILRASGTDEAGAAAVRENVETVQQAITTNPKRWYHLF